jgi:hypothetical protein
MPVHSQLKLLLVPCRIPLLLNLPRSRLRIALLHHKVLGGELVVRVEVEVVVPPEEELAEGLEVDRASRA